MSDDQYVSDPSRLSGLELAKYVLLRLTNDMDTTRKIAEDFDNDESFIKGVINFLYEIRWLKMDATGNYRMTSRGKNSLVTSSKRRVINWSSIKPDA